LLCGLRVVERTQCSVSISEFLQRDAKVSYVSFPLLVGFKVWRDMKLPAGKILIPGVVSHATALVEHPELVADRIITFAELVGRENVMAGTDAA
jgi:methionine synthase II (cobalamin-independent)